MKVLPLLFLMVICLVYSCRNTSIELQKLDLQPHGIPVTILAPDSAAVLKKEYPAMRDITVRKGDRYFLQIFEFDGLFLDAAGEKLRLLEMVREDPGFSEIILEEDSGFIFSRQADSTSTLYDFRHIKILGQKELIFQAGLVGDFSLEDVKTMYKAVQ